MRALLLATVALLITVTFLNLSNDVVGFAEDSLAEQPNATIPDAASGEGEQRPAQAAPSAILSEPIKPVASPSEIEPERNILQAVVVNW
jgi:hypothetical protein